MTNRWLGLEGREQWSMPFPPLHVSEPPKPDWSVIGPVLTAFAVLAAGVAVVILGVIGSSPSPVKVIVGLAVAVVALVLLIRSAIVGHRRLVERQRAGAERMGFAFKRPVKFDEGRAFLRGFRGLNGINSKGRVTWFASGVFDGRPVAVCVHVTSKGEEASTLLAAVTPCPAAWPACRVQKGTKSTRAVYGALARVMGGLLSPPLEGFEPGVMVTGADQDAVRRLLDVEFQRSVVQSPVMEQWEVNEGRLALVVDATASKDHWLEWAAQRLASAANHLESSPAAQ